MPKWTPFVYRDFYDAPRMIVTQDGSSTYLLWSRFDEALDDYRDVYDVYRMPPLSDEELRGSWVDLEKRAIEHIGTVPVRCLTFDSGRHALDLDALGKVERVA